MKREWKMEAGSCPCGATAEELGSIIAHSPIEFYIIGIETLRYRYVNQTACTNTGYSPEAFQKMDVFDLNPELSRAKVDALRKVVNRDQPIFNMSIHRRKDGSQYDVQSQIFETTFRGEPAFIIYSMDVTERRRLEQIAAERGEIIDKATNEIYILDYDTHRYLYANQGACSNLGYTRDELLQMDVYDINPELTREQVSQMKMAAQGRPFITNTSRHRRKDGSMYPVHALLQHIDYQGHNAYMIINTDMTEIEAAREALRRQAYYDHLTGLPNRLLFNDRLEQALRKARRSGKKTAVLFIDYDHFKQVNDTFGHDMGDKVLVALAGRLKKHLRFGDTLARMSGDEFLVLLEGVGCSEEMIELVQRIAEAQMRPVRVEGQEFHLSCSIGCALSPMDGEEAETLVRHADMAMYHAKEAGRNRFRCYSHALGAEADAKLTLLSQLRRAQEQGEFFLRFQPQISLQNDAPVGMEALLRWRRSDGEVVQAIDFIGSAVKSGIMNELGHSVLEMAMRQMNAWDRAGFEYGRVSVNLSMLQLADMELPERIAALMQRFGIAPHSLEFEITETEIMAHPEQTISVLRRIRELGVSLAVDDFGTGHASLAYLKRFPIDRLKIDRDFIAPLPRNSEDVAIVRMITALGDALGLEVVAEGVETQEQLSCVETAGCQIAQGFYYAKAIDAEELPGFYAQFSTQRQ